MVASDGGGEGHVRFGDAADARMQHAHRHFLRAEPAERTDQRLDRALDIGLDDQRKLALAFFLLDLGEELLQVERRAARDLLLPGARLAELGDLPRTALVLDHHDLVAR